MHILNRHNRAGARSAILVFGTVAGSIWLLSLVAAMVIGSSPWTRVMPSDFAGVTTVLMIGCVLPAMLCARRGWWVGVVVSILGSAAAVAGLVAFASA